MRQPLGPEVPNLGQQVSAEPTPLEHFGTACQNPFEITLGQNTELI